MNSILITLKYRYLRNFLRSFSSFHFEWTQRYRIPINTCVKRIEVNSEYERKVNEVLYIPSDNWKNYLLQFRRRLMKQPETLLSESIMSQLDVYFDKLVVSSSKDGDTFDYLSMIEEDRRIIQLCSSQLFTLILSTATNELQSVIAAKKILHSTSDLRLPHEWYPYARLQKRKIIYHGGPTNSGKTYHALQRLINADTMKGGGTFCGPLRLLALEVYEKLNREGAITDLLTGQEKIKVPFSTHTSCTVEMANLEKEYDVAVIDEIQMIADSNRGWAWTRALLGLRAREIHVCGGLEALEIVKSLVSSVGDEFTCVTYERLSTLQVLDHSLGGDYSLVKSGDCIVAFTRQDLFSIKSYIEKTTKFKCAIIYGQLPPEVRSMQARLFNERNGYEILVASDAIGMGLNLNIGRIIFHTTRKKVSLKFSQNVSSSKWIPPSSIKQIAGRAGRLSSQYDVGEVTTWQDIDLPYVKAVMSRNIPYAASAGVFPLVEHVRQFEASMTKTYLESFHTSDQSVDDGLKPTFRLDLPLSAVMNKFLDLSQIDNRYFMCTFEDLNLVSNWLNTIPLSIEDRFVFASSPVDTRNTNSMNMLYQFAANYALRRPIALNVMSKKHMPRNFREFTELCSHHIILDLYLWLSTRYPTYFVERDVCAQQKEYTMATIKTCLDLGRIKQDYSHSDEYIKEYQSALLSDPDFLPPREFGEMRELTKEIIEKSPVKPKVRFV